MTDIQTAPPPPPPAPATPTGSLERLGGALFSPDETFREIAERPNVLVPIAILVIVTLISSVLLIPRMDFETMMRDQMERSGKTAQMAPGDVDRAVRIGSSFAKVVGYTSPAVIVIMAVIVAGALLLTFRMFGGEGTFKQAFSVTLYAWLPIIIRSAIGTVVGVFKGTIDPQQVQTMVASNPGIFVDLHEHPVLFSLLSSFDLFTIWSIVLLIIGFAYVARTSKGRSAAVVLGWWFAVIFFKVGFAAFGAMRMKVQST